MEKSSFFLLFIFLFFLKNTFAQNQIPFSGQILLQWFNSDGQLVEVNWKRTAQWVWKENKKRERLLQLELLVQLPKQLRVKNTFDEKESKVQILDPPKKEIDSNLGQTLSILTTTATFSTKLSFESSESAPSAKNSGLFITINAANPQVLIHASCEREGLQVLPLSNKNSKSFFFGISCLKEKKMLGIHFHIADTDALKDFNNELIPEHKIKVTLESKLPHSLGIYHVHSEGITIFNDYEIVTKEGQSSPVIKKVEAVPIEAKNLMPVPRSYLVVGLHPTHLTYTAQKKNPDYDPSEFLIEVSAQVSSKKWIPRFPIDASLRIPLVPLLPRPFQRQVSGVYSLIGGIQFPPSFRSNNTQIAFFSAARIQGTYFRENAYASHFYAGPEFYFLIQTSPSRFWGERDIENRLGFSLMAAPHRSPVFQNFLVYGTFSIEMAELDSKQKINLESKVEYQNLIGMDSTRVSLSKISLGVQVCL